MNAFYKFQNREQGITLIEILVVMIILGIFLALVGRSFMPQIFRAKDTVAQDKVKIVYEQLQKCAADNDSRVGSFEMITDANCVDGTRVENKVRIAELPSAPSAPGTCWDSRFGVLGATKSGADADVRALSETPDTTTTAGRALLNGAAYSGVDSSDPGSGDIGESTNVVFICTYKSENPDRAGASGQHNEEDSTYYRISVTSNNTTYFFVRTPQGNQNCSIRVSDGTGEVENKTSNKLKCR